MMHGNRRLSTTMKRVEMLRDLRDRRRRARDRLSRINIDGNTILTIVPDRIQRAASEALAPSLWGFTRKR